MNSAAFNTHENSQVGNQPLGIRSSTVTAAIVAVKFFNFLQNIFHQRLNRLLALVRPRQTTVRPIAEIALGQFAIECVLFGVIQYGDPFVEVRVAFGHKLIHSAVF